MKQNNKVAKIARDHSIYMDKIFFMHHSEWRDNLPDNGVNYSIAGENVVMGYTSPEDVMKGWMNSPGHKSNIFNPKFEQIGIGYSGKYTYKAWTQIFYTPL